MYEAIFNDIQNRLAAVPEVKLVEWYLGQDSQKGGIVNSPCVLVRFESAAVTQIAKSQEQANISFELLIYTDFKKGNAKLGADTNLHFEVEDKIHAALAGYERSGIVPIERQVGLLKSSMEFICRTTACIPVLGGGTTIPKTNISPQVDTTLHTGGLLCNMQAPKRNSTLKRYYKVYNHFNRLFEKKHIRYDDCILKTADDLDYSPATVEDILRKVRNLEGNTDKLY